MKGKPSIDAEKLKAGLDIVEVIGRYVPLKKAGAEFVACCPFHSEKTPSFKVSAAKGIYHCFGCGAQGDVIEFVMAFERVDFVEACRLLGGETPPRRPPPPKKPIPEPDWVPVLPAPEKAFKPPENHFYCGQAEMEWAYRDAEGRLLGYMRRFRKSDGGKEVIPLVWAVNRETGEAKWRWQAFTEPRPLYGLDRLAARAEATVLVVEGEKCADAATLALPDLVAVSWPGGGKAVDKADWQALAGRAVAIWPDCDSKRPPLSKAEKAAGIDPESKPYFPMEEQPGMAAALKIQAILKNLEPPAKVWMMAVPPPGERPDGWDIADAVAEGLEGQALLDFVRAQIRAYRPPVGEDATKEGQKPLELVKSDTELRRAFEQRIEATEDFDELAYRLVAEIERAGFHRATRDRLIKQVARKTGVSMASLLAETQAGRRGDDPGSWVEEMNEIHAVVTQQGQTRIMNIEFDPIWKRTVVTFSSRESFLLRYCNRFAFCNGEQLDHGSAWLQSPGRREYQAVAFMPGVDLGPGVYNLWQGFGTQPVLGAPCARFLNYFRDIICMGCELTYWYVWGWLAHLFQRPQELPGTALVLRSVEEGTGKSFFVEILKTLVGAEHAIELTHMAHLTGQFSAHRAGALLVFANEATWGGDKAAAGVLKGMVTDSDSLMEEKHKNAQKVKNFVRLIVASNHSWPIARGEKDRRMVVLDVPPTHAEDWDYFAAIQAELEAGGFETLMHLLMNADISDWHPREVPLVLRMRGWEIKLKENSIIEWYFECLEDGFLASEDSDYARHWSPSLQTRTVREAYAAWCRRRMKHMEIESELGKALHRWGIRRVRSSESMRPWLYEFPALEEARRAFMRAIEGPEDYWEEGS